MDVLLSQARPPRQLGRAAAQFANRNGRKANDSHLRTSRFDISRLDTPNNGSNVNSRDGLFETPLSSMLKSLQKGIQNLDPTTWQKSKWERQVQKLREEQEELERREVSIIRTPPRPALNNNRGKAGTHPDKESIITRDRSYYGSSLPVASERKAGQDVVERGGDPQMVAEQGARCGAE